MHGVILSVLRLTVWLALLSIIFMPLERLSPVVPQKIFRRDFAVDLFWYFFNSALMLLGLSLPVAIIGLALRKLMPHVVLDGIAGLPLSARLLLTMVVGELGYYWGHRLSHEVPFLWRFHAVHHSATEVDFLTNTRAHPVDLLFTRLCSFVPIVALGLGGAGAAHGDTGLLLLLIAGQMWSFFIHANLRWRFGFLERLISTPAFHRWHHTNDAMRDRNYASMFPWLDWIFGTYYVPKAWPETYGIDGAMPGSVSGQLLAPLGGD